MNEDLPSNQSLFPLSPAQQRLWFLWNLDKNNSSYNMPYCLKLDGVINQDALYSALEYLIKRHNQLRANFFSQNGDVLQKISPEKTYKLETINLNDGKTGWQKTAELFLEKPFDLEKDNLFRFALLKISETSHILLASFHHIIGDGISLNLFFTELKTVYSSLIKNEEINLPQVKADYSDYVNFTENAAKEVTFLDRTKKQASQLADIPSFIEIPTDKPYPKQLSGEGRVLFDNIDEDLRKEIGLFCNQNAITPFMFYLSAFGVMLNKFTHSDKFVVGVPFAGRAKQDFYNIFGYFVNTIVISFDFSQNLTFQELIKQIRAKSLNALDSQDIPLDAIINTLNPERSSGRNPLVQIMFSFQNVLKSIDGFADLKAEILQPPRKSSIFELTLDVAEGFEKPLFYLEYNTNLFTKETISNLSKTYLTTLRTCLENPFAKIFSLNLLSDDDKKFNLNPSLNNLISQKDVFLPLGIAQKIAELAQDTPNNPAIYFKETVFSYSMLDNMANAIAAALTKKGAKQGDNIGIVLPPDEWQIPSILGVMKMGGVFVPLDYNSPAERLNFIIDDANIKYALSKQDFPLKKELLDIDFISPETLGKATFSSLSYSPESTAYIIYTSGTTGKPKGIKVSHQALENHCAAAIREYEIKPSDCTLFFASLYFDAALEQIFPTLLCGGSLVQRDALWSVEEFLDKAEKFKITIADVPPLYLRELVENTEKAPDFLRLIIAGGEALPLDVAQEWSYCAFGDIPLINAYGPTEAVITSTYYKLNVEDLKDAKSVPIGRAFMGRKLLVLDKYLKPVIRGSYGELFIGGDCLAQEYLNLEDLTLNSFIDINGQRFYKTGDLVRINHLGLLEFGGRIDRQIKVRGFRIEAGEVETAIMANPSIKLCHVKEFKGSLVAYIETEDAPISSKEIISFAAKKLPEYMLPQHIIFVDKITFSGTGKVDEKSLPDIEDAFSQANIMPKENLSAGAQKIAAIWKELLGRENILPNQNFFEVGGHSLLLLKLHSKLQKEFKTSLKAVDLFNYPTIETQAEFILGNTEDNFTVKETKNYSSQDIAVIGVACRFPEANNQYEFWQNLKNGIESIKFFDDDELIEAGIAQETIDNPSFVPAHGSIENHNCFDFNFFGYNAAEAKIIDPQQRVFLEEAYHALEDAGYDPWRYQQRIGVFAGVGLSLYLLNNLLPNNLLNNGLDAYQISMANDKDFLPMRVSYKLNLRGPSVNVNTACSSSLVAVHTACESLICGKCEIALAGGVSVQTNQKTGYLYQKDAIMSPDGHCRAFADDACGTVGGSGCGIVVLKRLEDAIEDKDHIYAVIKSSAINNDGSLKVGFTAPSVQGQKAVIEDAYNSCGLNPEKISYIETHGTATKLGDPIEIDALNKVFSKYTRKKSFCAVGSVKSNVGHLDTAAGVAGLIKTVMALKNAQIPPSLNCSNPSPVIDFNQTPFFVNTSLQDWKTEDKRYAGVSSFGMGGTNAHIVLEEFVSLETSEKNDDFWVVPLSAETQNSLESSIETFADFLSQNTSLNNSDLFFTLAMGRKECRFRKVFVGSSRDEVIKNLKQKSSIDIVCPAVEDQLKTTLLNWQKGESSFGNELFENKKCQRISLPTYAFVKTKCWIDAPKTSNDTRKPLENWFYSKTWKLLEDDFSYSESDIAGSLILYRKTSIQNDVLNLLQKLNIDCYEISNFNKEELASILKTKNTKNIIYLDALEDFDTLNEGYESYFGNIISLARIAALNDTPIIISVITKNMLKTENEVTSPLKSIILGVVKTINKEYSNIKCRCLDISELSPEILTLSLTSKIYEIIALRKYKLVPEINPSQSKLTRTHLLTKGGNYIVFGASGGIGAKVSEYLAQNYNANLVLISRSKLQDNDIRMKNLVKHSGKKLSLACDINDDAVLQNSINEASTFLGKIDGIFHCVGTADNEMIASLSKEHAFKIMSPKITATNTIYNKVKNCNPKFILLCSSTSGNFGEKGHSSYSAANAYLDAFATEYNNKDGFPVVSIAWDFIANNGIAAKAVNGLNPNARKIFSIETSPEENWVLGEHILNGQPTMPATGYIDFAANVLKKEHIITFKDVILSRRLSAKPHEKVKVNLYTNPKEDFFEFAITSNKKDKEIEHLSGLFVENNEGKAPEPLDISVLQANMKETPISDSSPDFETNGNADFKIEAGKHWQFDKRLWCGDNEALIKLSLSENLQNDFEDHSFYPSLTDIATAFYLSQTSNTSDFIPFKFGEITIYQNIKDEIYSYCKLVSSEDDEEKVIFDIIITTNNGEKIADIKNYVLLNKNGINKELEKYFGKKKTIIDIEEFKKSAIKPSEIPEIIERSLAFDKPYVFISTNDIETLEKPKTEEQKTKDDAPVSLSPQEILTNIISELMEITDIDPKKNIFDLGVDSFLALQIASKVKDKTGVDISLDRFFASPTVEELSKYLALKTPQKKTEPEWEEGEI
ncbi:MAG: amino acid adenylation domain-containing protein [Alphaproteobacteria bacterium]